MKQQKINLKMLKKIKSFLSKIMADKRLKIILFSFIVLFSIFIPLKRADALWGIGDVGLFDLTETQLDALDFIDSTVLRLIVYIAVLIVWSEAFVFTAANLLQWAMNLPINIGATNLLVTSGWQFTLGLTNLFFILAFVIIALAHILGLSTLEMKKALPKLIIIGLLVNFSLVFIQIFVDIVNIFQSTLLDALGENLVTLAIQPLIISSKSVIAWFLLIPAAAIASAQIPFWNAVALSIIGSTFLADIAFGGVFLKGLFLIIINFFTGSIFSFYFILFLMRIVMIWILAIFAPLAFFSYILPQTQGIWKEWRKTLMEWLILGIIATFLTGLGLKFFSTIGNNAILNWGGDINTGRGSLPSFIYNYLFMLVFMGITAFYSMKYTPEMANTLLNYGKSFAGGITKIASARTMKRDVWGPAAEEAEKQLARPARWGESMGKGLMERAEQAEAGGKTTRAKFFRWTGRRAAGLSKAVGSFRPGLIEYGAQQRRTSKPKGWDQMTDTDKANFVDSSTQDKEKLVWASTMKREGSYQRVSEGFREKMRAIRDKFANNPRYIKEIGDLNDAEPNKISAAIKIETEIVSLTGEEKREKRREIGRKIREIVEEFEVTPDEAAGVLHAQGFSSKDVAEVTKSSVKSLPFRLASRKMGSSQLRALQNNFDEETIKVALYEPKGLNTIDQGELDRIYEENPGLVRWAFRNPAGRAMLNWADRLNDPS